MKGSVLGQTVLFAGMVGLASTTAFGQGAAQPAEGQLPEVEVIQQKAPPAKKAAPVAKKGAPAAPVPMPPPAAQDFADELPELANSPYGSPASGGAQARAEQSAQTPVNPTQLIPDSLEGFSAAGTNLTPDVLQERQPRNINEALSRVPGVIVINDDANAHHGGIGIRGAQPRRSRKMLIMEDGHAVNLALWLDPSVHYWAPVDRLESIEVLRGTVITHGPNNNFGVVNARNLSPFGPAETVISSAIGFTRVQGGSYSRINGDILVRPAGGDPNGAVTIPTAPTVTSKSKTELSGRWHTHTRQHADNVGVVASYTGANVQGAWDTEQLRFHDFYGAIGWKGSSSDIVVSSMYARQRDNYDEQNYLGEYELNFLNGGAVDVGFAESFASGRAEREFRALKHCKSCFAPAAGLNTYAGEIWRGQIVHNAYLDDDITITTRLYGGYHSRDRFQLISPFAMSPYTGPTTGAGVPVDGLDPFINEGAGHVTFGRDTMFGRLRTFRHVGGEVRTEFANRDLFGLKQDIQAGIRYEYQDMTNKNILGASGEVLKNGSKGAATFFDRSLEANTVSAFLQTNIHVARDFNVVPGIRFEWYDVNRRNRVVAAEEGEAEGLGNAPCNVNGGGNTGQPNFGRDCGRISGIDFNPNPKDGTDSFNALPGIAFAYTGLNRSTVFGGYNRGLTTNVLRNEDFPSPDEIGDNFNLGFRNSAIRGFDFEVVGFHQRFKDFQYGESFSSVAGDREFGRADKAEISGVELFGRLNSQPFTGGPLNFFAESNYTYSRALLKKAFTYDQNGDIDDDFSGNRIPEVPWHVAAFTLGVEQKSGWRWDASVTWTYRGSFYTDAANTPYGRGWEFEWDGVDNEVEFEEAGEVGGVPSVWLLSARFNLDIGDSGASVFVAGDNLLNKLYITDREDGMKPGLGRTIWTGFKYKF